MYQTFDAFEYIDYLRGRWRVVAVACAAAIVLSFGISLLLPKRYTATARVVIDPPGGNDIRLSTAVSPIYLESLKTYESFAGSDTLFVRAAERFHLLQHGDSIESLKRRILKVSKIRDTKILEISATLADPKEAQSFAQYVADETVNTSRNESLASDRDFISAAEKQAEESRGRLAKDQKDWGLLLVEAPVDTLRAEIDSGIELQSNLRQQLVGAEADAAEYQQQGAAGGQFVKEQLQAAQARVDLLNKRLKELDHDLQQKNAIYASRLAKRDQLQNELRVAQSEYDGAAKHLQDLRASAGMHAEQLRVIDPGIVPERPSSPNISLNVAAALFLALISSVVYLSLAFAYRRRSVDFEPAVSRSMRA